MSFFNNIVNLIPALLKPKPRPLIRGWNRLEGNPRKADFSRSLRAEIRDPLWMLSRQWQFGEFAGEDAGSPIMAEVLTKHNFLNRYAVDREAALAFSDDDMPLETQVEREAVPDTLDVQLMLARYLIKVLKKTPLGSADLVAAKDWLRQEYPIAADMDTMLHRESEQFHELGMAKSFNGYGVMVDAATGAFGTGVDASTLPDALKTALKDAADTLPNYFGSLFSQPAGPAADAWKSSSLEYQFTVATEGGVGNKTLLLADQYASGHLDWYAFDIDNQPGAALNDRPGETVQPGADTATQLTFLPAPVSFGGMPLPRYWEMEDYKTEFADVTAHTTDVAKLLLTEFALIHSNDWCIVPFNLQTGSLTDMKGLVVTDVFGERLLIGAAGQGTDEDWQRWTLFNLHTTREGDLSDHRLFLPPAIHHWQESAPLEKVNFLRDEMANMVWGVESVLPAPTGHGISGHETAQKLRDADNPTPPVFHETEAKVRYVLGTEVPYNWIPFVPVHNPGSNRQIRLQRAKMPGPKRYKGKVLDHPAPYFIHEEEVPRAGALVTRSYQRTRWYDGATFLWIGKRKQTGRGEGESGLQFDQIKEVG